MPFWDMGSDEANKRYKEALRYRNPEKKDFDLRMAINYLGDAIRLRPDEVKYREQLADTYLAAPELAIVPGVNLGAELSKSAQLAVARYEEILKIKPSLGMDFRWFLRTTRAYLYLGEEKEKVKKRLTEAWMSAFIAARKRQPKPKEKAPAMSTIAQLLSDPEAFYLRRAEDVNPDPSLARKHLQQAVLYRGQRKLKEARKELEEGKKLAPDLRWLYETMCQLAR